MSTVKITRNYQVTIPSDVRKALGLKIGAMVDFVVEKGAAILKPKTLIDKDQDWFWSKEWQDKEKEAHRAIEKGEVVSFDDVDAMRRHFEK